VFYRLFGAVSPVTVGRESDDEYTLEARFPWEGTLSPFARPELAVFAVAMVYVVSFDGFANTGAFQATLFQVREATGLGPEALLIVFAVGFALFLVAFWLACWLAEYFGSTEADTRAAIQGFAPTLLPIVAAYEVAHNYPYVARSLGQLLEMALEPLVPGIGAIRPLGWLPLPAFWGSQVLLVVVGHGGGRHRALRRGPAVRRCRGRPPCPRAAGGHDDRLHGALALDRLPARRRLGVRPGAHRVV